MALAPVPHFQLYGERESIADPGFVHVETIERRSRLTGWTIQPHCHDTLDQLLIVRRGEVAVTLEGRTHDLTGPAAVHVPAGVIHGFAFHEAVDGVVVTFSTDLHAALRPGEAPPFGTAAVPLSAEQDASVQPLVEALWRECGGDAPGRIVAAGWLVGLLLVHVARAVRNRQAPSREDERVQRFRLLVDRHFHEQRPLAFYADALGLTERSLTRLVRGRFACSPMLYIHRRLLLEARRMLVYGTHPIARIAEELGFSDPSYFSRFHLRMTGVVPSAARTPGAV